MKTGILWVSLFSACACAHVFAEDSAPEETPAVPQIVYDNASGVTDLTSPSAWVGGVVPGAGHVAVFDGATPGTLSLGATTEWAGIVRTNSTNVLTLQAPDSGVLRLGAEGWLSGAADDNNQRMYLDVDVELVADQRWGVWHARTPCTKRSLSGTGRLTLDGNGNVMFFGPVTASVSVGQTVSLYAVEGATMDPVPTFAAGSHLYLLPGTESGPHAFADLFPGRSVASTGIFTFGGADGNHWFGDIVQTTTLGAGDALRGPNTISSSRDEGHIRVQDAHVVVEDGADVTGNIWWDLRSGSWTQKGGDTAMSYAAIVGRGSAFSYGSKVQRLDIQGGTFKSRRLSVGVGNSDAVPAEFRISGGTYQSGSPLLADASQFWAWGLAIAQRSSVGETYWNNTTQKEEPLAETEYSAGRVEITGGTVKTPVVIFGNDNNVYNLGETRAGARIALRGGELQLGPGGFRTGAAWQPEDSGEGSWYDAVLSGGVLSFAANDTVSSADLRLTNRDGGAEIKVATERLNIAVTGSVFGPGTLRKTGGGALRLMGANDYTGRTEVVEGKVAVGNGFDCVVWSADDFLGLADSAAVTPWANHAGSSTYSFTHGTTIPGTEGTTPPTVSATALNGHPAAVFDGSNTAFMTGNAAQPFSDKSDFTVALVFQTEPGFTGCAAETIKNATQIFGTSIDDGIWTSTRQRQFGLAVNAEGRIGCGLFDGCWTEGTTTRQMADETLWATNTVVNDGRPHVLTWTWSFAGRHRLTVDKDVYELASVSNGVDKIQKTRIVLAVGEKQNDRTKRLRGAIAEILMSPYRATKAETARLAAGFGRKYGVAAFADDVAPSDYAEAPASSAAEVPAPTARWSADTLTQSAGEPVTSWAEADGKGANGSTPWAFTTALADLILKGAGKYPGQTANPVVAADTLNGHKLVSFNGADMAMALTGSQATPAGDADGLTVAAVVRFTGATDHKIGNAFHIKDAGLFLGQAFGAGDNVYQWGLALSSAGRVGAGARNGDTVATARSRRRFLDDGEPHVVVLTYPKKGSNAPLTLTIDGRVTVSANYSVGGTMQNTRILLGGSENGEARYVPVDIAAFAFWKSQVLTPEQIESLTRALCAEYGVYAEGYERFATGCQQRSAEIFVHAGAAYGGLQNHDFTVYPGQTIWGDGTTPGLMHLAPGAAVKATATTRLDVAKGVRFADGALIRAAFTAGAELQPVPVTGNLLLDGNVVVDLDVAPGAQPGGPLLTWTGVLGTKNPTFTVTGAKGYDVRIDETGKCLKLVRTGGTMLLVR